MKVRLVQCKSASSPSRLPGLDWALNPYRGCGHACAYCYAQDVTRFEMDEPWGETVEVKVNFVQKLKRELEKGARGVYGLGTVTDPYQPLEKRHELSRGSLALLKKACAKVSVLTKSDLVLRDLDLMRGWYGLEVGISVSCLDDRSSRIVEPGAPPPNRRFEALERMAGEGVSVYLMLAPVIPSLGDSDESLTEMVERAASSSVKSIIWDKYNPKPLAGSRLRAAFAAGGIAAFKPHDDGDVKRMSSVLRRECRKRGIALVDAF